MTELKGTLESYDWFDHPDGPKFVETHRDEHRSSGHWLFLPAVFSSRRTSVELTKAIVLWVVLGGAVVSNALLLFSIARPDLRFWPLPPKSSWRHAVMRLAGPLAPVSLIGVLVLGVLDWDTFAWQHWSRFVLGGLFFASGGAFALWGAIGLGLTASQGHGGPLVAQGAYRFSRNPQYVGTVAVLVGYGLICNFILVLVAVVFWSWWYLLAPFAEEPWLREKLGGAFEAYAGQVRRYL